MNEATGVAKGLIKMAGADPRRYVPGTARIHGQLLSWDEKCRIRCPHTDGLCHSARSANLPTGQIDLDGSDQCECPPCPGRGSDGHGLTHCAECCFGSGVVADITCPTHGDGSDR